MKPYHDLEDQADLFKGRRGRLLLERHGQSGQMLGSAEDRGLPRGMLLGEQRRLECWGPGVRGTLLLEDVQGRSPVPAVPRYLTLQLRYTRPL
ncbi:hypothetical protein LAZ67_19001746 [Cordylochernes scorpioides]|uniref:Uncharacterized protein n=1 Tax=Cordylochernes scorpioides TaxID=51811 RepID=A0ABY6LKJ7_9ARAC|nr:hypothetical protein LAZ67_19001746 [Cordylochernes scorpioides]